MKFNEKTHAAYLAAITKSLGPERPRRWKATLEVIEQYLDPKAVIPPNEFAEVFEDQYAIAGRPLLSSGQFGFYLAAYINSHWYTGRRLFDGDRVLDDFYEDGKENAVARIVNLNYSALLHGANTALAEGKVFDLPIAQGCVIAAERGLSAMWAWYLGEVTDIEPVVLASSIGCSLHRVVEAKLGMSRTAPPPGDVYLLEELEVPFEYYEAFAGKLHISDIVRLHIQDIPLEYALMTH